MAFPFSWWFVFHAALRYPGGVRANGASWRAEGPYPWGAWSVEAGLQGRTARVVRDGVEREIPVQDVAVGDEVLVRPGEKVPVDAVVLSGSSAVDERWSPVSRFRLPDAAATPSSAPPLTAPGRCGVQAAKVGADTMLAQIIRLVQQAQATKAPIQRLALVSAVAVLIIACPCALGLAMPLSINVGTGKGARAGILIRSAEALETAHKLDTVVLDKTGTITAGKPALTDIRTIGGIDDTELLTLVAAAETDSEHPLAARSSPVVGTGACPCRQ